MDKKLLPCPFCGGAGEIHQITQDVPDDIRAGTWVVGCDGVHGNICPGYVWKLTPFYATKELAVRMWNERE